MKIYWSDKHNLSCYKNAPKSPGIYIIGTIDTAKRESNDSFFGENFPQKFCPRYVGVSKRSIRGRLSCHSRKKGNRHIKSYIELNGRKDLQFVYFTTNFTEIEHAFLFCLDNFFEWNIKKYEGKEFFKYIERITR